MSCAQDILYNYLNIPNDIVRMILDYIIQPQQSKDNLHYIINNFKDEGYNYNNVLHYNKEKVRGDKTKYHNIITYCLGNPILNSIQTRYIPLESQINTHNTVNLGYSINKMDKFYIIRYLRRLQKKYKIAGDPNALKFKHLYWIDFRDKSKNRINRLFNFDKETRDFSHLKDNKLIDISQKNMFSIKQQEIKKELCWDIHRVKVHIDTVKHANKYYPDKHLL